ncbi:hypothetical protein LTR15_008098 [Elasticomyces elasticus]|nr:hypothetical protein LTR15_008098 [Elasticomyces elasticus]
MPVTTRAQAVANASKDRLEAAKALTESVAEGDRRSAAGRKKQQAAARKEFRDWVKARPKGRRTKPQLREELYAYFAATEVGWRNVQILEVLAPQSKGSKESKNEYALSLNYAYNRPDGWD